MLFKKEVRKIVEEFIGRVKHFYSKPGVVILEPSCTLRVGDNIRIVGGRSTDFTQIIRSMELNHKKIEQANAGDLIGIKVKEVAQEGCKVYLLKQ